MTCFTSAMAVLEMVGSRVMARRGIIIRGNAFCHRYTMYIRDKPLWSLYFSSRNIGVFHSGEDWTRVEFDTILLLTCMN
jgi:hypothetical protein